MNRRSLVLALLLCLTAVPSTALAADAGPTLRVTPSVDTITPGRGFSYLIDVTGPDGGTATEATLTVTPPPGADVIETPSACDSVGDATRCSLGTLASGSATSVPLRLDMPPGQAQGTATVNAVLECIECAQPVSASAATPVTPQADLTLALEAPQEVAAGQESDYLVRLSNLGPSTSRDVTVSGRLPAPLRVVSAEGCSVSGHRLTCRLDDLPPQRHATRRLRVTTPDDIGATRSVEVTMTAGAATTDPDEGNNAATASSTLRDDARVTATTTLSEETITPGKPLTYTSELRGLGPSPAENVQFESRFPQGVRPAAIERPATGCTLNGFTVTCALDRLARDATTKLVVRANPDPALPEGKATLTTTVSCDDCGPRHRASVVHRVQPAAELVVTASGDHSELEPGDSTTDTVTVTNKGPSTATDLKVVDTLPSQLTLVSSPGCTAGGHDVTCPGAALPPGGQRTWRITTRADAKIDQPISLTSHVRASMAASIKDADPRTENATITDVEKPKPPWWPWALGAAALLAVAVGAFFLYRRRARPHPAE